MLVAMAGLPASGKSTIAAVLAERLGAVLLSKDTVRATLFPTNLIEYSSQQDDFCIEVILQVAGYLLERDSKTVIIIDGRTFSKWPQIERIRAAAGQYRTTLKIIQCVSSEETARNRIEKDQGSHLAGNRDFDLYLRLKVKSDPIVLPKLVLDTDREDPAENVLLAEKYLTSAD
jgi:predicted kinase